MDLLDPDDLPLSVHEDILKYLRQQDLLVGEDEEFVEGITNFTENQIKEILEELLQRFERNQKLKEEYEERVKAHNQYQLFTLENILPEFQIDDEMYEALTFRETLIIQHMVGETELVPEPVGGLCLDIQQAPGKPPPERRQSNINTRLSRILKGNENADVIPLEDIKVDEQIEEECSQQKGELEDSLGTQRIRNANKFLVHLSSQFNLDGYNAGSTITTWVDKNLHTLEEARKEFYTAVKPKPTTGVHSETSVELDKDISLKTSTHSGGKVQKSKDSGRIKKRSMDIIVKSRGDRLSKRTSESIQKRASKVSSVSKVSSTSGVDKESRKSVQISRDEEAKDDDVPRKSDHGVKIGKPTEEDKTRRSSSKQLHKKISHNHTHSKHSSQKRMSVTESSKSHRRSKKNSSSTFVVKGETEEIDKCKQEGEDDEIQTKTIMMEKSLYVGLFKGFYYIKHLSNEDKIDDRKFYSLLKAKDYISEGANFILQRYLAKTIYIGSFELSTMYINGDMCRNIYNCTGPESQVVNDRRIDVCRIYRTIIEECGIEHKCTTILTLQGQIVNQTWEGINYILQINPLLDLSNYKPVGNEQILLKHAWESDMQLMSKYLDEKIENDIKIKSYMIDHPEFRNMISDYIHTILLLKPEDIIEFTISHFLSFAPQFLPQNDYFNNY